jgi:hypothetical protein
MMLDVYNVMLWVTGVSVEGRGWIDPKAVGFAFGASSL